MEYLAQHIEGLIFTSEHPLSLQDLKSCLDETFETQFSEEELQAAVDQLIERYRQETFAFEVLAIGGGYQFLTKGAYHQSIGTLLKQSTKKRLSRAALETLSIIAYKQPVSKGELEKIRGVSCDYAVQKLLEKELVTIIGRSEKPGRPLLYGTSEKFMDYFGLNSIAELPKPKDFKIPDSEVGEAAPIEEGRTQELAAEEQSEEAITLKREANGPGEEVVSGQATDETLPNEAPAYEANMPIESAPLGAEASEKDDEQMNPALDDVVGEEE
ncbi:MAG: SMC-Scp complex subunit ScpB [Bacteroidota bacterium]